MLITFDVKGLEVVVAAFLSNCPVLRQELLEGQDIHANNQRQFNLKDRLNAKRFKFKMIFGGTSHGFVKDPDFQDLKLTKKEWEVIIDNYYTKYHGIKTWHEQLISDALSNGSYTSPSGRTYSYQALFEKYQEWFYIPKIKNYPVQGFGADIVMLARILIHRRFKKLKLKSLLVNTIHDSIIIDAHPDENPLTGGAIVCYNVVTIVEEVFRELPEALSKHFDINFDLPLNIEHYKLGEPK